MINTQSKQQTINKDVLLSANASYVQAGLSTYLARCYQHLNYKNPTPIQYYSIYTYATRGYPSILAQSKSGTGKTLGYISLVLINILNQKQLQSTCHYLIIVPTRELSMQVYQVFKQIINSTAVVKAQNQQEQKARYRLKQVKLMMCIGGIPFEDDRRNYQVNGGNVIIGTIGRVVQLIHKKLIAVDQIWMLVLDEGDKLLQNKDDRFKQVLQNFLNHEKKTTLLIYSATFNAKLLNQLNRRKQFVFIQTLADCNNQLQVRISQRIQQMIQAQNINDKNKQHLKPVLDLQNIKKFKLIPSQQNLSNFNAKIITLINVLKQLRYQRCLVFVQKKSLLQQLNVRLIQAELQPLLIHGSLAQSARIRLMNQINQAHIIISSDLLARGIDIELDLVVLFDAKRNDTFWHRIGRTGRYDKAGVVISLDEVSDWQSYNVQTAQQCLDCIAATFNKSKDWYGTYLTEVGNWAEATIQNEVKLAKEYKYFKQIEQVDFVPAVQKMKQNILEQHDCSFNLSGIKNQQQLSILISKINSCQKCRSFMSQIESLTGYKFTVRDYKLV